MLILTVLLCMEMVLPRTVLFPRLLSLQDHPFNFNIEFVPLESMNYQGEVIIYSDADYTDTLSLSGIGY